MRTLMYSNLRLPWSQHPSRAESTYRAAGLVRTKGTIFLSPPPRNVLEQTYNAPPRPKTRMSAGAVALCKHFERGGSSSEHGKHHPFWTLPTGSNDNKTKIASQILDKMFLDVQWENVMLLHQEVAVYEIRNSRGYGMRWTLDISNVGKTPEPEVLMAKDEIPTHLVNNTTRLEERMESWSVQRTTFRGFLEPIIDMDHELP